jgi:hypothetical protein
MTKHSANVPSQDRRLVQIALSHGINAVLAENQRSVASNVLQTIEVRPEFGFIVHVHIEAAEILAFWIQELRGWKIDKRRQAIWGLLFGNIQQLAQESLDSPTPLEADDVRWQLVGDADR